MAAITDDILRELLAGVLATTPAELWLMLHGARVACIGARQKACEQALARLGYRKVPVHPLRLSRDGFEWQRDPWPSDDRWPDLSDDPRSSWRSSSATSPGASLPAPGRRAMAGLEDLAKRLDRIAVEVEGNVERAVKDCAEAVLRSVVEATPVDTGFARSNWTPELDRAFEGLFHARVPGKAGSTAEANAAATVEAGLPTIEAFDIKTNESIHITNNAPHIGALNDGHSKQVPADFVRLAALDGLATVRQARVLPD